MKLLLGTDPELRRGINSTGIWMVEQQEDGSCELKMHNDEAYPKE